VVVNQQLAASDPRIDELFSRSSVFDAHASLQKAHVRGLLTQYTEIDGFWAPKWRSFSRLGPVFSSEMSE
jgi:hypothetical protein